jgi:hypothetical protein
MGAFRIFVDVEIVRGAPVPSQAPASSKVVVTPGGLVHAIVSGTLSPVVSA